MGQKNATLGVAIDQSYVTPGSDITGKIYLSVAKDEVTTDCLVLRMIGQENTCAKYTTHDKNSAAQHYIRSHCRFFELSFIIATFSDGKVSAGQYEYPFKITLPLGLPSSLSAILPGENGGDCTIGYYIETKLHRKGIFKWDVEYKLPIRIFPSPLTSEILQQQFPVYALPVQQKIHFCCCMERGNVILSMFTPTACLHSGDEFDVSYLVNNLSSTDIKAIEISAIEEVHWTASGRKRTLTKTLYHSRLDKNTLQLHTSPVVLRDLKNQNGGVIGEYIVDSTTLQQLKEVLDSRRFAVHGTIGSSNCYDVEGTLISCKHYIQLTVCTTFGSSNPTIIMPFALLPRVIVVEETPTSPLHQNTEDAIEKTTNTPSALPADWRPTISETVDIPLPDFVSPVLDPTEQSEFTPSICQSKNYSGIGSLFNLLRTSYYPLGELQVWLQQNSSDLLTIKELELIYSIIASNLDKLKVTDLLLEARPGFTCEEIAGIAKVCNSLIRIEIIKKLGGKCVDKEHYHLIQRGLLPFEFLCVENIYVIRVHV